MENQTREVTSTDGSIKLEPVETTQSQNEHVANTRSKELADSIFQLKMPGGSIVTVKGEPLTPSDDEINPQSLKVNYKPMLVEQHQYHVKKEFSQKFRNDNSLHLLYKGSMYKNDLELVPSVPVHDYCNLSLHVQATLAKNGNFFLLPEPDEKSLLVESAVKPPTLNKIIHADDTDVETCQTQHRKNAKKGNSCEESNQYTCNICRKKLKNYENMKKHIRLLHNAVKHACEECGKVFATLEYLKRHALKHRGIKPFSCNQCSKSFYEKGHLRKHTLDKHINLKPHECNECSKKFNHKSELLRHMVIHTGYLKHRCNICFKNFSQSGYLNSHMMIHTGLTPYKCPTCNEKFPIKNYLTKHMIKHTTERPFECKVCKKKFKEKRGLDRHVIIHEYKKPLTCFVCGSGFSQKGHMSRHIAKYHQEPSSLHEPEAESIIC